MNHYETIKHLPPSSVNNARSIAEHYLEKFTANPNRYWATRLEELGIGVDWKANDNEISEPSENFYDGELINNSEEIY